MPATFTYPQTAVNVEVWRTEKTGLQANGALGPGVTWSDEATNVATGIAAGIADGPEKTFLQIPGVLETALGLLTAADNADAAVATAEAGLATAQATQTAAYAAVAALDA